MSKAIVFDVGKVLVNFSFDKFKAFLANHGANFKDNQDFFEKSSLLDFEKGFITEKDFLDKVNSNLTKKIEPKEIKANWEDIFTLDLEMFEFAKKTAKNHPTYLLSNTNPIHWPFLERTYGLTHFVNGFLTSHEAKAMKPNLEIYKIFVKKFDVIESNLLFIDDMQENIEAAIELGWNAVLHTDNQKSIRAMNEFLS